MGYRSRVWIDFRPWMPVVQKICSEILEGKPAKIKIMTSQLVWQDAAGFLSRDFRNKD